MQNPSISLQLEEFVSRTSFGDLPLMVIEKSEGMNATGIKAE